MKLFLAMMLVLAVAVVPALAQQGKDKGATPGAGSGTSEPAKPAESGGSTPSASPGQAPSASPGGADAPASKEDCKNFAKFTTQNFKNEAECVTWVEKKQK